MHIEKMKRKVIILSHDFAHKVILLKINCKSRLPFALKFTGHNFHASLMPANVQLHVHDRLRPQLQYCIHVSRLKVITPPLTILHGVY